MRTAYQALSIMAAIFLCAAPAAASSPGSDLVVIARTDNGNVNTTPLFIRRADGYVGIGSTSPAYRLHIDGQVAGSGPYVNTSGCALEARYRPARLRAEYGAGT